MPHAGQHELLIGGFSLRCRDKIQHVAARGRKIHPPANALEGPAQTRTKFTCQLCNLNAWAKPRARLACVDCSAPMSAAN